MKIAIDVSPLQSGHKVRGVGFYLSHLKKALERYFPNNSYIYFTQVKKIPNNIELIHYPYFDPFFLTLPFFKKKKTVVTVHDLTPLVLPDLFPVGLKGKAKWLLQRRSLQGVDAIITDSESSKNDIAKLVGIPKKKITVAYLAPGEQFQKITEKKALERVKDKYNLPDVFILYVGDVTANKNLPRLVRASLQTKTPLVMAGKALVSKEYDKNNPWNRDLTEVQRLVKENTSIVCLGFVPDEDMVSLYNLATVFAMPSLYEGFGLPIVEAMACGCPVVTSEKGSLKEVAEESAYIVDPYSIESIAEGLEEVLKDKKLQQDLSGKGLLRAKNFSWEKTVKETVRVYEYIIG